MSNRIGKQIIVSLPGDFYFKGECVDDNESTIALIDIRNERVEIAKSSVIYIREEQQ